MVSQISKNRIFRHVSDAFSEDPLRVFRVARFYATLKEYEFKIHDSTVETMKKIVESGEIDFLSKRGYGVNYLRLLIQKIHGCFFKH